MPLRHSPVDETHRQLGAKMAEFAGWEMPISYPTGTLAEHEACRSQCAIFDVSHLGTVRLTGSDALGTLQSTLTNDLGKISPGRAQYTHLLDPMDASVSDDIIVWWIDAETFDVMPNASNTSRVTTAIGGVDTTESRAILAVQGPTARSVVAKISEAASAVRRFHVQPIAIDGAPCVVAGTGYTGEDGIEIAVPREHAASLWTALTAAGAIPAGLGARDTLRLEAALPLHGHELGPGITPLQARLEWVVAWGKGDFRGREILQREKENGIPRLLHGISVHGRRPARDGCSVLIDGRVTGHVTSGNFSPTLGHCIALALLDADTPPGTPVQLDVRGQFLDGVITKTPFVKK